MAKGWVVWEVLKGLKGFFAGDADAETAKGAVQIAQQTTSALLPSRDDEAILLQLDTALADIDPVHLTRIQRVRDALNTHQNTDWRKNIGKVELISRFELLVVSAFEPAQGAQQPPQAQRRRGNQQGNGQPQQNQQAGRKLERQQINYAFGPNDHRVKHLLLVSKLVQNAGTESAGIKAAKQYLIGAGLITEKSAREKSAELLNVVAATVYQNVLKMQLGRDTFDNIARQSRISDATKHRLLAQAARDKRDQMRQDNEERRRARLPQWFWIAMGSASGVLVIIVFALLII